MYKDPAPEVLQKIKNIVCSINVLIPDSLKLLYEIYSCSFAGNHDVLKRSWV